jgi:hypothetical protein
MNPRIDNRIRVAKIFARHFNHFEWGYLCSHQWFLTGIDQALGTGNFAQLEARAEQTLVDDKIRSARKREAPMPFISWLG